MNPFEALEELRNGNDRFVAGTRIHPNQDAEHRSALADVQAPFAVIFGCSDSRLAAEIIFDQGLGDLFVVRTAGHTVGPQVLGSVEFAVTQLHTSLIVILGHNNCGAVKTARSAYAHGATASGHLAAIVDGITPSIELAEKNSIDNLDHIVDLHIEHTLSQLREQSEVLASAVEQGNCAIVGVSYQLSEGKVRIVAATDTALLAKTQA